MKIDTPRRSAPPLFIEGTYASESFDSRSPLYEEGWRGAPGCVNPSSRFACSFGFLVTLALIILSPLAQAASRSDTAFEAANRAFGAGKYAEAISGYEKITKENGYSAAVLFNLGNAYYHNNQFGRAILNYERALRLSPRDPDIQEWLGTLDPGRLLWKPVGAAALREALEQIEGKRGRISRGPTSNKMRASGQKESIGKIKAASSGKIQKAEPSKRPR